MKSAVRKFVIRLKLGWNNVHPWACRGNDLSTSYPVERNKSRVWSFSSSFPLPLTLMGQVPLVECITPSTRAIFRKGGSCEFVPLLISTPFHPSYLIPSRVWSVADIPCSLLNSTDLTCKSSEHHRKFARRYLLSILLLQPLSCCELLMDERDCVYDKCSMQNRFRAASFSFLLCNVEQRLHI